MSAAALAAMTGYSAATLVVSPGSVARLYSSGVLRGAFCHAGAHRFPVAEAYGLQARRRYGIPNRDDRAERWPGWPSSVGTMLIPSVSAGAAVPASSHNVGSTSQNAPMKSLVDPALIRPGQRARKGVRMPPS